MGQAADKSGGPNKDTTYTVEQLAAFNGKTGPMFVGVCGKVYDVSSSPNFAPDQGYGALWAGCDATYALAHLSLQPEDVNRLDWSMDELNEQQLLVLGGWARHFAEKYIVVGALEEYSGWSFEAALNAAAPVDGAPGVVGKGGAADLQASLKQMYPNSSQEGILSM